MMPKLSWLKPERIFRTAERVPDMQVKDLARLPDSDPFLKALFQRIYQHWETACLNAGRSDLTADQRAYFCGQMEHARLLIVDLEQKREMGKERAAAGD